MYATQIIYHYINRVDCLKYNLWDTISNADQCRLKFTRYHHLRRGSAKQSVKDSLGSMATWKLQHFTAPKPLKL